jgi:hypothetical protein
LTRYENRTGRCEASSIMEKAMLWEWSRRGLLFVIGVVVGWWLRSWFAGGLPMTYF